MKRQRMGQVGRAGDPLPLSRADPFSAGVVLQRFRGTEAEPRFGSGLSWQRCHVAGDSVDFFVVFASFVYYFPPPRSPFFSRQEGVPTSGAARARKIAATLTRAIADAQGPSSEMCCSLQRQC
jgi:hypothetical protein